MSADDPYANCFVNFPYRWTWRTSWKNISYAWWDIRKGVANLWRWLPWAWNDADFDADFLLKIMEFKLRRMAKLFIKHGTGVNSSRQGRKMLVAAALCRRIRCDNYCFELDGTFRTYFEGQRHGRFNDGKLRDARYLGLLLGKHIPGWWD